MGGAYTAIANDLGASEYNPAGLTYISHIDAGVMAIANRTSVMSDDGASKETKWDFIPTNAGFAMKAGSFAVGLSRKIPQSKNTYQKFSQTQYYKVFAPDGYPMQYDSLSDKIDTSDLATYAVTAALKLGRLSLGANYNYINGDISREFSGKVDNPYRYWWWAWYYPAGTYPSANDQFKGTNNLTLKGYTMDFGALMDMGILRLGATAKNAMGSVDVSQQLLWRDNFAMGPGNWFTWQTPKTTKTLTKFAPTYTAGAALVLGKILTVDLDYVTVSLEDSKKAQGRLGAELAVIPGFLFARAGINSDFKNIVQDQDQKTMKYFVGAGLKMLVLTVDAAASLEQAKEGSDGGNMSGAVSAQLKF
ncbi:MAG: hypothetical protein A3J79_05765 [Elusimicrobia bacterium RIFOXYB2_FULL_62_6]|nr:MAG: hypothetical protein A3J79_05765 [Elusimicrobia bacterium RIFOXYB2_FULL_62_6]